MGQSRRFLDWTNFSGNRAGFGLVKESIRGALEFDSYAGKRKFQAIALETAYNLTPIEAAGYGAQVDSTSGNKKAQFIFKARVIDENSPHSFLPDPCFLMDAGNKGAAIAAIKQHTTFVSYNDPGANLTYVVNTGDIVEVELEKGLFSYNLQQGRFIRIVQRGPARTYSGASCQKLADHFGTLPLTQAHQRAGGGAYTGDAGDAVDIGDVTGVKFASNVEIFQGQKDFLNDLRTRTTAALYVTSGYRNPMRQASAMLNIWTGTGEYELRRIYNKVLVGEVIAAGQNVGAMAAVIEDQVARGKYISRHLYKSGLDLNSNRLTDEEVAEIVSAARSMGARVGLEPGKCWAGGGSVASRIKTGCYNEHIHIGVPKSYMENAGTSAPVVDASQEHETEDTGADGDDSAGTEGTSWRWLDKDEGKWEWIDPAPPSVG